MNANFSPNNQSSFRSDLSAGAAKDQAPEQYGGILKGWYRLTAPPPASANATIEQRQRAARGQLTSGTLLLMIIMVLLAEPSAFMQHNTPLMFILLIPVFIDVIALFFNRSGQIAVAGVLVIVGIEVGIMLSIAGPAFAGGGLSPYDLPQYDLLVQATLVAVTLLPPRSVIVVVFFHVLLTIGTIFYLPHNAELATKLATDWWTLFLRPFTLQVTVGVVTYLWVVIADQAVRRADRAEVIAELERREVERQTEEIELKQQLEDGVQQVLGTLNEAANGNFEARTRIAKEDMLFRVGYAVNNLLARLQSFRAERAELEKTRKVAEMLATAMRDHQPLPLTGWTGTCLDPLIMQMQGPGTNPPGSTGRSPQQQPTNVTQSAFPPQKKRESRDRVV